MYVGRRCVPSSKTGACVSYGASREMRLSVTGVEMTLRAAC